MRDDDTGGAWDDDDYEPRRGALAVVGYLLAGLLGIGLFVGIVAASIWLLDSGDAEETDGSARPDSSTTTSTTDASSTTTTEVDRTVPGEWQVTGVDPSSRLNVRAEPGPSGAVVGRLRPFARSVEGTGEVTEIDGVLWQEIRVDSGTAWTSSEFLAPFVPCAASLPPEGSTVASEVTLDVDGDDADDTVTLWSDGTAWHLNVLAASGEIADAVIDVAGTDPVLGTGGGLDVTYDDVAEAVVRSSVEGGTEFRFYSLRHCDWTPLETDEGEILTLRRSRATDVNRDAFCIGEGVQLQLVQSVAELDPAAGGWVVTTTRYALVGDVIELQGIETAPPTPSPPALPAAFCPALTG